MFNIKYMGRYKDKSQLLRGELSKDATQYDEPDNIMAVFLKGSLISLPFILILLGFAYLKFGKMGITTGKLFGSPASLIAVLLSMVLIVVHELLHAIWFPKESVKEIWVQPEALAAFVYCNGVVSKRRFIWLSFCPNIILGLVPYVLWLTGIFDFNLLLSQIIIMLAMFNIAAGIGDYFNIYSTIRQVPKNAWVRNYGFHTFWFIEH